jgi:hypothetical protein
MRKSRHLDGAYILGLLLVLAFTAGRSAWAGTVSGCTEQTCTWEIFVDGATVMTGSYVSDPETGDISFGGTGDIIGEGYIVSLDGMSGNIDPVLGFGLGASNTSGSIKTFAFAFSLPLGGLTAPPTINTNSQLGTTLTAFTGAGGSVFPTLGGGNIVDSQDIMINPFVSVDKGVDIGAGLSVVGMGTATNIENAASSIVSGGPFDIMSVTVAFGLADQTGVGFSGFVQQTPVPIPPAVWLFGSGLLGLVGISRRKKSAK